MLGRLRVRSPALYTGWTFFHIYLLETVIVYLKKTEMKWKRGRDGPFLNKKGELKNTVVTDKLP